LKNKKVDVFLGHSIVLADGLYAVVGLP